MTARKSTTVPVPTPETTGEPNFLALSALLAAADAKARGASADAGAARAERSTVAVSAILAAFKETASQQEIRDTLLGAGVLKGTVSKIITVVTALYEKVLGPSDVKSLNGAYNAVKAAHAALAAGTGLAGIIPAPAPVPVKPILSAEDALDLIVSEITSEKDPELAFKLAGDWITKITNRISDAVKELEEEE